VLLPGIQHSEILVNSIKLQATSKHNTEEEFERVNMSDGDDDVLQ
jgi:hypothetical protein